MSARQYIRVLAINALARRAVGVGDNVFGKETVEDIKNTDPQLHALMMKVESACAELANTQSRSVRGEPMSDHRIKTDINPLMTSPVVVRSASFPTRIVLYRENNQYITHEELLTSQAPNEREGSCSFKHHSFYQGGYFPYKCADRPSCDISEDEARYQAEADFKERVRKLFKV